MIIVAGRHLVDIPRAEMNIHIFNTLRGLGGHKREVQIISANTQHPDDTSQTQPLVTLEPLSETNEMIKHG